MHVFKVSTLTNANEVTFSKADRTLTNLISFFKEYGKSVNSISK